jgi:ABC-2 type transport system permease protein
MSALDLPSGAPAASGGLAARLRWAVADGLTVAKRNLTHVRYVPEKLLDVTVQPLMFVVLFVYVFGGAIHAPGGSYRDYLMAGIFVQTLSFSSASSAISIADDMAKGVVERMRSLPMARSAVLVGRTGADLASAVIGLTVLVVTGLVLGWRMHDGVLPAVAGLGILLLFAYAMTWVGTLIGLVVRAPDAAQGLMFVFIFPLTFVSNSFVPTPSMPRWLQTVAEWNPLSAVTAACRELFGNATGTPPGAPWPLQHPVIAALGWSVLLLVVFSTLSVNRFRARTRG